MDSFSENPDHLKALQKDLERKTQENYELKLKLQQKENLENDYKIENDSLAAELVLKEQQVKSLETRLKSASAAPDTSKKDLLIDNLKESVESLTSELKATKKELESAKLAKPVENWDNSIREELSNAQNELKNMETVQKENCVQFEAMICNLRNELDDKNKKLCHLESNVQSLKEELEECKEEFEQCEGELQLTKNQLMTIQKASVEKDVDSKGARGNSLFSEVEDNRLVAMAALKNTKKDAEQAVRNLAAAQSEIHALKVENLALTRKWEEFLSNHSILNKTQDSINTKMTDMIKSLTKKLAEAESKSLSTIADLLPDTLTNHQWLKTYLKNHSSKENDMAAQIRDLEMRLLWAEEGNFQMKKKYNVQLAENSAIRGQLEKIKLEIQSIRDQENQATKAILPAVTEENVEKCAMTPSRERALKKILDTVYLRGKKTGQSVQFAAEVKQEKEDETSEPIKPVKKKPTPTIISIQTSTE